MTIPYLALARLEQRLIERGNYVPVLERRLGNNTKQFAVRPLGWDSGALVRAQEHTYSASYDAVTKRLLLVEYLRGRR